LRNEALNIGRGFQVTVLTSRLSDVFML
jgi:hypothetical protein